QDRHHRRHPGRARGARRRHPLLRRRVQPAVRRTGPRGCQHRAGRRGGRALHPDREHHLRLTRGGRGGAARPQVLSRGPPAAAPPGPGRRSPARAAAEDGSSAATQHRTLPCRPPGRFCAPAPAPQIEDRTEWHSMSAPPIVEMTGISISFPGVKALDGVDFRLFPGEVHALMGENGAGKSTLIKALTGVYTIDEGQVRIGGSLRRLGGTADAQAAGVSTVYQEVNLCTNISIGENVMLGHETRGPLGIFWRETHRRASEMLEKVGLGDLYPRLPLSTLSIALQQLVAISRGTVTDSKALIMDEPTSSLDANEVENLFTVIRARRDDSVAILFVSHFLDQIYAISDRMTVLRNGTFQGEFMTSEIDQATLIATMVGKEMGALDSLERASARREVDRSGAPVYSAEALGRKGTLDPTDFLFCYYHNQWLV